MKTIRIIILILSVTFLGCDNSIDKGTVCDFDNPLTDLSWLKAKIDEVEQLTNEDSKETCKIYQCIYGNGKIGFFEDMKYVSCFYDCEGNILCSMGGITGEDTCQELEIDFENKILIWELSISN